MHNGQDLAGPVPESASSCPCSPQPRCCGSYRRMPTPFFPVPPAWGQSSAVVSCLWPREQEGMHAGSPARSLHGASRLFQSLCLHVLGPGHWWVSTSLPENGGQGAVVGFPEGRHFMGWLFCPTLHQVFLIQGLTV